LIAPEHELAGEITISEKKKKLKSIYRAAALKSDLDRTDLAKEKTGVLQGGMPLIRLNAIPFLSGLPTMFYWDMEPGPLWLCLLMIPVTLNLPKNLIFP
jgi:hypothetical protein